MKSSRYTLPRVLPAGGTIGVFSPAGAPKPERVARGVEQLHARGYRCIIAPHAIGEHEYFSAPDDVRLADFNALLGGLKARGTAILMVTHDLLGAADCADRIGFLAEGRIIEEVHPGEGIDVLALHHRYGERSAA